MFEVGFTEIILILGLALLVLGPEKLPALAEKVGRWTGRARAMARQLRTQLEHEVTMDELSRSRPMQSPANPASDSTTSHAPYASPPPEPDPSAPIPPTDPASMHPPQAHSEPPHSGPGLDLDTVVSGIEPPAETPAPAPETIAAKSVQ